MKARADAAIIINTLGFPAVALAVKHRVAAVATNSAFAEAGCLMSYAADSRGISCKPADYVDRILKGAKPADLPVEQPTAFELVINQKIAKALGINAPQSVPLRADKVLE